MSITQTTVEERLMPATPVAPQPISKATKQPLPSVLLRSSSFDRLKQFPSSLHAYFCRHGSIEFIKWLSYSQTQLYSILSLLFSQLRSILLVTSVYAAVGLISIQFAMCILALSTVTLPNGFAFLLTCIFAMAAIAIRVNLFGKPQQRRSRSRTRHIKQE